MEKVETSTALHACRTIPSTRQNNSDHASATLCTVPVDAKVDAKIDADINAVAGRAASHKS
ncbi:hypothetical protein [Bradyrhizobium mercantei]|uniref:hypothetical protein n=1 Tax=Bradyrhizobium mercantei TaxID=1904807 RepID=UPI00117794FE|nr:hypothetical protein [Bradyrhizobium mercantei]